MKKFLSLALALVMCLSLVTISAGATDFTDSDSVNYKEAVDVISELGIVDGYTTGDFRPTDTLTRGAAAKIICNLRLGPTAADALGTSTAPFKDVPVSNNFAGYIAYCSAEKIINGYGDGSFRPGNTVTGFQFLKMLLGALGYDSTIEQFTGSNWTVKVASLAMDNDLTKGNSSFVGTKAMTREEACLYAFNTLKATLVEYENKGSNITVGGVEINTSASKAQVVTSTVAKEQTISSQRVANSNAYTIEFAEKYFPNLRLVAGATDKFERPANTWRLKNAEIGTYPDTPDLSYTTEVKMGTIYSDLGLSSTIAAGDVTFHIDGAPEAAAQSTFALVKGETTNKIGGNGALTEVFYDDEAGTVIITVINTYLGKVQTSHAATSTRDAYVTIDPKTKPASGINTTFETDAGYAVDSYVLYNYSYKTGDVGIQAMEAAESVTGTLSAYTVGKSVTVGGTVYSSNVVAESKATIAGTLANAMRTDVTVYLDSTGYAVYVDADAASDNYAVVLGYTGVGAVGTNVTRNVTLLFADGTTKTVVAADNSEPFVSTATPAAAADIGLYDIVSYRINSDGEYQLAVLSDTVEVSGNAASGNATPSAAKAIITKGSSTTVTLAHGKFGSTSNISAANSRTVVLVKNGNTYSTYTGIANIPTVSIAGAANSDATNKAWVTTYVKPGASAAALIFIEQNPNTTISSSSKDVIFIKGNTTGMSHDADLGDYYTYDAIVNGEITTIYTAEQYQYNTLVTDLSRSSKNVYSQQAGTTQIVTTNATGNSSNGLLISTTVTDKAENGSITLGGVTRSIASDCKVFFVSADGNDITESSVSAIGVDGNDKVLYKLTDNEVSTIVVITVDETTPTPTPTNYTVTNSDIAVAAGTNAGTLKVTSTNTVIAKGSPTAVSGLTLTATVFARDTNQNWVQVDQATASVALDASGKLPAVTDNMATALTTGSYRVTLTLTGADVGTLDLGSYVVAIA